MNKVLYTYVPKYANIVSENTIKFKISENEEATYIELKQGLIITFYWSDREFLDLEPNVLLAKTIKRYHKDVLGIPITKLKIIKILEQKSC